ncbi:hypothetical protein D6827_00970, partial [Candidatus Parcubacteria bacterium]
MTKKIIILLLLLSSSNIYAQVIIPGEHPKLDSLVIGQTKLYFEGGNIYDKKDSTMWYSTAWSASDSGWVMYVPLIFRADSTAKVASRGYFMMTNDSSLYYSDGNKWRRLAASGIADLDWISVSGNFYSAVSGSLMVGIDSLWIEKFAIADSNVYLGLMKLKSDAKSGIRFYGSDTLLRQQVIDTTIAGNNALIINQGSGANIAFYPGVYS